MATSVFHPMCSHSLCEPSDSAWGTSEWLGIVHDGSQTVSDPRTREDLSRFLVHLTRDYEDDAEDHLLDILKDKTIEARNAHCLFSPLIKSAKFSPVLKKEFNTVCFTETPLPQVSSLLIDLPGRNVKLKPCGLVFWRTELVARGANPAVYINAKGSDNNLRRYLLEQFKEHFRDIKTLKRFKSQQTFFRELIHYYSLITLISTNHNFAWEREWRFRGDFTFKYKDVVAVIAEQPKSFMKRCEKELGSGARGYIRRIPCISPYWSYEEILEEMSVLLWQRRGNDS